MKKFLVASGMLLSLFAGYGSHKGDNQAVAESVYALSESRGILISGLGVFGSLTAGVLFLAMYTEKRRNKKLIAEHDGRIEEFKRALRRKLS